MKKQKRDAFRDNITKGELLEAMKQIERDRGKGRKVVGMGLILVLMTGCAAAVLLSCGLRDTITAPADIDYLASQRYEDVVLRRMCVTTLGGYSVMVKERPSDEVLCLREKLNPHGISVFRVRDNDPEHQRRYERHYINPR